MDQQKSAHLLIKDVFREIPTIDLASTLLLVLSNEALEGDNICLKRLCPVAAELYNRMLVEFSGSPNSVYDASASVLDAVHKLVDEASQRYKWAATPLPTS